jgi:hypothetical protein
VWPGSSKKRRKASRISALFIRFFHGGCGQRPVRQRQSDGATRKGPHYIGPSPRGTACLCDSDKSIGRPASCHWRRKRGECLRPPARSDCPADIHDGCTMRRRGAALSLTPSLGRKGLERLGALITYLDVDHIGLHRLDARSPACAEARLPSHWALAWSSARRCHLMVQRIQPGRRQWSRPGACRRRPSCAGAAPGRSSRRRAAQHRADRRTEALGQAHRDRIEVAGRFLAASTPSLTAALYRRAPSRCRARPCSRVNAGGPCRQVFGAAAPCPAWCFPARAGGCGRSGSRRA